MYKSIKTMTQALQEARAYRDPKSEGGPGSGPQKGGKKFSDKKIKQAYGILNDPRYKQGNYSGASRAIDKLAPGLSDHPDVANALKRANEELEEKMKLKYDKDKEGFYDEKGRRRYLSIGATNAIMRKKLDHAMKTGDWTDFNKEELEEEFKVKFIDPANKKKFHITYRSKGEAEAKMAQLKNDGVKEIEIVQEELEEELISERRYMVTDYFFSDRGGQVGLSVVVDAANENQAEKKALDKIEKLRDSPLARRKGVDDPTDMGMDVEITNKPLNYTDIEKDTRS